MIGSTLKRLDALEERKHRFEELGIELTEEQCASLVRVGLNPNKPMPDPADLSLAQLRAVASIYLPGDPTVAQLL